MVISGFVFFDRQQWGDWTFTFDVNCGRSPTSATASLNATLDTGFHADLIVEDKVIVELKSVETVAPVHKKQLLSYLRLADKRLGLLINFNAVLIKTGITERKVRRFSPVAVMSGSPC